MMKETKLKHEITKLVRRKQDRLGANIFHTKIVQYING